ncbi:MAG TPA: OsmC family protein [Bacteroidia bacterium]|jgi:putative redox protein|nr:OsmC family protein [Bacteroidia bacterium]
MPNATANLGSTDFEMTASIRQHKVIIDEPTSNGGQDKGPSPTEMLCASLASCTIATIKMYLNHKQLKAEGITVEVDKSINAEGKVVFTRKINVKGTFDADQKSRLLAVANKCPIHKMLETGNIIESSLV